MPADLTHTLGLDDSPLVQGFDRAEARARTFGQRVAEMTPGVKGMQEGFQRVQSLVVGMTASIAAAAYGIGRVASGVVQFRNAGEYIARDLENYRQINVELDAQLTTHQRITREIQDRYEAGVRRLATRDDSAEGLLKGAADRYSDQVFRNADSDLGAYLRMVNPVTQVQDIFSALTAKGPTAYEINAAGFLESQRSGASNSAEAALRERAGLEFAKQRLAVERDIYTLGTKDDLSNRANAELAAHSDRLKRIQEIEGLDTARQEKLIGLENRRHEMVLSTIEAERAARARQAAETQTKERTAQAERRASAEDAAARTLEDLRVGNLRAAGLQKEADLLEAQYTFARMRSQVEGSEAGSAVKQAALAELRTREQETLALLGLDRGGRPGAEYQAVAGTGIGATATRQVLGGSNPIARGVERTAKTTEQIRDAMKEIVAELRKQVGAVFN